MGFGPQQEAPPAEKEAAPAEAAPAEAPAEAAPAEAPAEAAPAEAAPAEAAPAEAPAEAAEAAAPAAAVTCKKYVECTCALAKDSGDKASCKDAKTAYKGKAADDCSADFTAKVQPQLDELTANGGTLPAKCQ